MADRGKDNKEGRSMYVEPILPGDSFSYESKSQGGEVVVRLMGYGFNDDGELVANFLTGQNKQVKMGTKTVDSLMKTAKDSYGEQAYFGGKVKRSSGAIEDGWIYFGKYPKNPEALFMVQNLNRQTKDYSAGKPVRPADFVDFNSPQKFNR